MDAQRDVVVVGAGISGLTAARELAARGRRVSVVEKSRGVGGRMASRRIGEARLDHGAQFFTTRSDAFRETVARAERAGVVTEWTRGFGDPADGHPRWRGRTAMTDLAKWMVADAGLEVELGTRLVDLHDRPARAYLLTAPIPQSLAVLSMSGLLPTPSMADRLAAVRYLPTIALLLVLDRAPVGLPTHGGVQYAGGGDFAFLTDNAAKGISAVPALTVHLSNELSARVWDEPDPELVTRVRGSLAAHLGDASVLEAQIQRWRYAGPAEPLSEPTVCWGTDPVVALAGEAFGGPKVEGAFLSGLAAGEAVDAALM